MKNWIQQVVEQHSEVESPKNFWWWSAASTISAVMKDQVWLDRAGLYKLYPNIYVMLHADSGLKKGPPVALAKRIVQKVNNTRIISGRSSIQGILKELGTAHSLPGGKVVNKSTGFIVASEFSSSLVSDPAAMTILTDLYDRHYNENEYKSLLKMETFVLKDPTITLLVATNEAHFEDFIAKKDIHGGFIGRMFVIAESQVQRLNPLINRLQHPPDLNELSKYPKELSEVKGEFRSLEHTPAGDMYEDWYMEFYNTVREQKIKDPTGTIQRFGDSVLKVAMILSLATDTSLIINEKHIEEAIHVCEKIVGDVRKTTAGKKGRDIYSEKKAVIIAELLTRDPHQVSRSMLLKKYWMDFKAAELDEMMSDFHDSGMILTKSIANQIVYVMPPDQVLELAEFYAGKDKRKK